MQQLQRNDKIQSKKQAADCPNLVKEYNRHMGGVDLTDSLVRRHEIAIKAKKWYFLIFYHLINVSLVNAWLLYKRVHAKRKQSTNILTSLDFRIEVAMGLSMSGLGVNKKLDRISNLERQLQHKNDVILLPYIPSPGIR